MKRIIHFLKQHKFFLVSLLAFSYILTLRNKIGQANSWDTFVWHVDTPIWIFLNGLLIFLLIHFIKRKAEKSSESTQPGYTQYFKYLAIGFVAFTAAKTLFSLLISLLFNNFERNFSSSYQFTYQLFDRSMDFFIFGGLSIAYLYWTDAIQYKKEIDALQLSMAKKDVNQLKKQLDPHFLFNNLNVLDQLIWEDQEKASDHLAAFADIYRTSLRNADKELIPLAEELNFAQQYFHLMSSKFEHYELEIEQGLSESQLLIPPYGLQVLIENAFAHNRATAAQPVCISIQKEDRNILVKNTLSEQSTTHKQSNGVALKNLSQQFELLVGLPVQTEKTATHFKVILPQINSQQDA